MERLGYEALSYLCEMYRLKRIAEQDLRRSYDINADFFEGINKTGNNPEFSGALQILHGMRAAGVLPPVGRYSLIKDMVGTRNT